MMLGYESFDKGYVGRGELSGPATSVRGWVVAHTMNGMITKCLVDEALLDVEKTTNLLNRVPEVA